MSTYPNLSGDAEMLKIKTKDDEIKDSKYRTEKHDYENNLKSLESDNKHYTKKYKSLNKKKVLLIFTEILIGSGSVIGSSAMSLINPSIGIVLTSSTALLTSIAILVNNEYISESKIGSTKLNDWINVITLLYKSTLKNSFIDKKTDTKEAQELNDKYNHYLDKRKEITNSTKFKVEDASGDVILNDFFSPEQITKLNKFWAKRM